MNKMLTYCFISLCLPVLSQSLVQSNATISKLRTAFVKSPQKLNSLEVIPIRSKTMLIEEIKYYYPQRSILGSINIDYGEMDVNYLIKSTGDVIQVYGDRKLYINEGFSIPRYAKFKILKNNDKHIDLQEYRNDLFHKQEIQILRSLEKGKKYLTEDKKFIIKSRGNDKYKVYETKKLIEDGKIEGKLIVDKIMKYLERDNFIGAVTDYSYKYNKDESIEKLNYFGIEFYDSEREPINQYILSDMVGWLEAFYSKYKNFIDNSKLKLSNIFVMDREYIGKNNLGRYLSDDNMLNGKIELNSRKYNLLNKFQDDIEEYVKTKYEVQNSSIRSVFVHEFGHYIEELVSEKMNDPHWVKTFMISNLEEFKKHMFDFDGYPISMKKYLGEYAISEFINSEPNIKLNYCHDSYFGEMFAEAFAEYFGGKNPRKFATIFGKNLEEILK